MNDYLVWLKKKLQSEEIAEQKAYNNYQDTGSRRYYTEQINHEYTARAIRTVIDIEERRDTEREARSRDFKGLLEEAKSYRDTMQASEALDKIIETMKIRAMFG